MKKKVVTILIFLVIMIKPECGIVILPVVDLIGNPIHQLFPHALIKKTYNKFPLQNENMNSYNLCIRLHQLLFNETVEILDKNGSEICIKITNCFYNSKNNQSYNDTYWTHKDSILSLNDIKGESPKIPNPIRYNNISDNNSSVIVLKYPWKSSTIGLTFSAGTRFLLSHTDENRYYYVWIYNHTKQKNEIMAIPNSYAIQENPYQSHEEKIDSFVALLKEWTKNNNDFIPYVWGGCSFTYRTNIIFKLKKKSYYKKQYSYYKRKKDPHIKTGFDCSGLILRAAQICSIPYFFKNTTTIKNNLKAIQNFNQLKNGDIIWIPGHVMIISDIQKNLLIEARSYQQGYGIVHEIELNKVFKDVHTFKDLFRIFKNNKTLIRIDKDGNEKEVFTTIALLSLQSCWK